MLSWQKSLLWRSSTVENSSQHQRPRTARIWRRRNRFPTSLEALSNTESPCCSQGRAFQFRRKPSWFTRIPFRSSTPRKLISELKDSRICLLRINLFLRNTGRLISGNIQTPHLFPVLRVRTRGKTLCPKKRSTSKKRTKRTSRLICTRAT